MRINGKTAYNKGVTKYTPEYIAELKSKRDAGVPAKTIAEDYKIDLSLLYKLLKYGKPSYMKEM